MHGACVCCESRLQYVIRFWNRLEPIMLLKWPTMLLSSAPKSVKNISEHHWNYWWTSLRCHSSRYAIFTVYYGQNYAQKFKLCSLVLWNLTNQSCIFIVFADNVIHRQFCDPLTVWFLFCQFLISLLHSSWLINEFYNCIFIL